MQSKQYRPFLFAYDLKIISFVRYVDNGERRKYICIYIYIYIYSWSKCCWNVAATIEKEVEQVADRR